MKRTGIASLPSVGKPDLSITNRPGRKLPAALMILSVLPAFFSVVAVPAPLFRGPVSVRCQYRGSAMIQMSEEKCMGLL